MTEPDEYESVAQFTDAMKAGGAVFMASVTGSVSSCSRCGSVVEDKNAQRHVQWHYDTDGGGP